MDLFDYASELLKQHGELKVPGLGYFAHVRKSSYYDKETGTLYPPYYETTFNPHIPADEDTLLIAYFSEKKNISIASSKYFLDKFVDKLKFQSETEEVDFSDLGTFYIDEQAQLAFRPNQLVMSDSATLFGYAPVSIQKLEDYGQPVKPRKAAPPVYVAKAEKEQLSEEGPVLVTAAKPVPLSAVNEADEEDNLLPELNEDEDLGVKSNLKFWISIGVFVVACAIGFIYYYKNYIQSPEKITVTKPVIRDTVAPITSSNLDTSKKNDTIATGQTLSSSPVVINDSTAKANQQATQAASTQPAPAQPAAQPASQPVMQPGANTAPVKGVVPKYTWLVLGGTYANINSANRTLAKYRAMGYPQARLLDSIPKKEFFFYKIIFSYHATKAEAAAARAAILKPRKLKSKYITVQLNK